MIKGIVWDSAVFENRYYFEILSNYSSLHTFDSKQMKLWNYLYLNKSSEHNMFIL